MKFHVTVIRSILFSVTLPPLRTNNKLLRWISAFCSRTSKVLALSFSSYDASTKLSVNIPSVPAVINNYERTIVAVIRDENIVKLYRGIKTYMETYSEFCNGKYFISSLRSTNEEERTIIHIYCLNYDNLKSLKSFPFISTKVFFLNRNFLFLDSTNDRHLLPNSKIDIPRKINSEPNSAQDTI